MSVRTSHRISAVAAPMLAAGLVLGACGGSDGGTASRPTVTLEAGATSYQTIPPATTVVVVEEAVPDPSAEQEYVVQAGDYGILVADRFGVSLADLTNINGWADPSREFPGPGSVILIPAGGTGGTPTPAASSAEDGATAVAEGETGEAIPEPGSNCEAGAHTVVAGDIPIKLTELYDVTLDALNAANANNPAYSRFIPGEQIVIPAKDDC